MAVKNRIQDEFTKIGVFVQERHSSQLNYTESFFGRDRLTSEAILGSKDELIMCLNNTINDMYKVNNAMVNLKLYDDF